MIRLTAWILVLIGQLTTAASAQSKFISTKDAHCIFQNADEYLTETRRLIVVYVSLCPNVRPSPAEIAKRAQNRLRVSIRGSEVPESDAPTVLFLKHEKLECLQNEYRLGNFNAELETGGIDINIYCVD